VPAQPLANLLQLCDEHLECVVLNSCYSDVQGNAIANSVPITIGMRDVVADNVAIKFSQGFYDAIGAGKSYEKAFEWGKVAIEFDLANDEATKIFVLRRKGESLPPPHLFFSANEYFSLAIEKQYRGDTQGALCDYTEAIHLNMAFLKSFDNTGMSKKVLDDRKQVVIESYYRRGILKRLLGDREGAITDYKYINKTAPNFIFLVEQRLERNYRIVSDIYDSNYAFAKTEQPNHEINKKVQKGCKDLEYLLGQKKWQEANSQTIGLLLLLSDGDIKEICDSPEDRLIVKLIDELWVNYSNSTLGFSIQKEIINNNGNQLGDSANKIGKQFGWYFGTDGLEYNDECWVDYETINWLNPESTLGHLPYLGSDWLRIAHPYYDHYRDFIYLKPIKSQHEYFESQDVDYLQIRNLEYYSRKSIGICDVVRLLELL